MTQVTIIGNLASEPELRFTPSGKAVVNFTVAESRRVKDGNEWKDGPTTWWRCSLWGTPAENLAESLAKGTRVVVVGEVTQREYEAKGEKRTAFEVTAFEVAASVKFAIVKSEKTGGKPKAQKPADDPWGASDWGQSSDQPPPF